MKIYLRVPTNTRVDRELTNWLMWMGSQRETIDAGIHYTHSHGVHVHRNAIVHNFLQSDYTHLWFIDADTVPPRHLRFLEYVDQCPVLCLPYAGYVAGKGKVWHVYRLDAKMGKWISLYRDRWPEPEKPVFKTDAAGTGCMIIRRDVLEKGRLPDPFYLTWAGPGQIVTEDLNFCRDVGGVHVSRHDVCRHYRDLDVSALPETFR